MKNLAINSGTTSQENSKDMSSPQIRQNIRNADPNNGGLH